MGIDRKIEYPEGLLLYHREGVKLQIIFETEKVGTSLEDYDKVTAIPGSAFIVDFKKRIALIPWKDYPLELKLSDCVAVPYSLLELYEKMAGV